MPPADDQSGVAGNLVLAEKRRKQMAFQMIDSQEGPPGTQRKSLRRGRSDKQRGRETRPRRCRKGIDSAPVMRLEKHVLDKAGEDGQVVPRSHLGNNASIFRMNSRLRGHPMGEHLTVPPQYRYGRFIAGRLDRKDDPAQEPFPAEFFFLLWFRSEKMSEPRKMSTARDNWGSLSAEIRLMARVLRVRAATREDQTPAAG